MFNTLGQLATDTVNCIGSVATNALNGDVEGTVKSVGKFGKNMVNDFRGINDTAASLSGVGDAFVQSGGNVLAAVANVAGRKLQNRVAQRVGKVAGMFGVAPEIQASESLFDFGETFAENYNKFLDPRLAKK